MRADACTKCAVTAVDIPGLRGAELAAMNKHTTATREGCTWRDFVNPVLTRLMTEPQLNLVYVAADLPHIGRMLCDELTHRLAVGLPDLMRASSTGGGADVGGRDGARLSDLRCTAAPDELWSRCSGAVRRSPHCIRIALAEMYALSSARTMIGTNCSTYSELAMQFSRLETSTLVSCGASAAAVAPTRHHRAK